MPSIFFTIVYYFSNIGENLYTIKRERSSLKVFRCLQLPLLAKKRRNKTRSVDQFTTQAACTERTFRLNLCLRGEYLYKHLVCDSYSISSCGTLHRRASVGHRIMWFTGKNTFEIRERAAKSVTGENFQHCGLISIANFLLYIRALRNKSCIKFCEVQLGKSQSIPMDHLAME